MNKSKYYLALVKREILQHRGAFIITPFVIFIIVQIGALFTTYLFGVEPSFQAEMAKEAVHVNDSFQTMISEHNNFQPAYMFTAVAVIICLFYLLDSLYSDRKDKSILFWRSLPFSEYENVGVKVLTSVVIIPVIYLIAGLISSLLASLIFLIGFQVFGVNIENDAQIIFYMSGLRQAPSSLVMVIMMSLFMLPLHLALLSISAFARRSPWLTLILPLLAITGMEFMFLRKAYVVPFLFDYLHAASHSAYMLFAKGQWLIPWTALLGAIVLSAGLYLLCVQLRIKRFEI